MLARFLHWLTGMSARPKSRTYRFLALCAGAVGFFVALPLLLGVVGSFVASRLPVTVPRALELAVGALCVLVGVWLALWATITFWRAGGGTPNPLAPTLTLVVTGPYRYCRNPIQLGAMCYYLGVGSLFVSLTAGLVMFLLALTIGTAWHKLGEENELLVRFGSTYEEYRRQTPFLFPRLPRKPRVD